MQQHWEGYLKAISGGKTLPDNSSSLPVAPYATSSSGKEATGFQYLIPKQPEIQAKYDAMKTNWEGPSASDAALASGVFRSEYMPVTQNYPYSNNK